MKATTDNDLVPANGNTTILTQGQFPYWETTEFGMKFDPNTPEPEWLNAVEQLCGMYEGAGLTRERSLMCLADAFIHGEERYGERWTQAIKQARTALGLTQKTMSNAMWAYKAIDASRRKDGLTLSHYTVIAALPPTEQDEFITKAETEHLTVSALKKEVTERHPKTKRGKERKTKETTSLTISNATEAKAAATQVSNWLTENEDSINESWKPLLEHFYRLYRRNWMSGHKKR